MSPSTAALGVRLLALAALVAVPAGARAQTAPPDESRLGCGRQAALFTGDRGFKAWITRNGSMQQGNPLRPLDAVTVRVLEAHIGSKVATAYGPDFTHLRRGLSPAELTAVNGGAAIHWDASVDDLPRELRIVADDGAPLAQLRFENCGEAPKVASAKPARPAKAAAKPAARKPAEQAPPGLNLPKGALE
jgi:hypothetical protein